jgi:uncharacterized protein (TIGR02145 family)
MEKFYLKTKFSFCLMALSCVISANAQTVTDKDGNVYNTVTIGNQVWTSSNLKVTKYNDGTAINTGLSNTDWALTTNGALALEGAYAVYPFADAGEANEAAVIAKYGLLYNAYTTLNPKGIAPTGWRVATDDDWKALEMHAGMTQTDADVISGAWRGAAAVEGAGTKLRGKSADWTTAGTDDYNFLMVPAGFRAAAGGYSNINARAYFWTSSTSDKISPAPYNSWRRLIAHNQTGINRVDISRNEGYSIRLVKIATTPVNLINYKVKKGVNFASLSWETLSEDNNDYFVVEHSSDGENFKELAKISGRGTTKDRQNYSFTDYFPSSGVNYYRLKQYDKDATVNNYGVRAVNFNLDDVIAISAHPNPVDGNSVTINFAGYKGKTIAISLLNSIGMPVYRENINIAAGQSDYILSLNKKPAVGQYILNIQGEGLEKSLKLIIK